MQFAQRKLSTITLAAVVAVGSLAVSPSRAAPGGPLFPEVLDASHAAKASSAFFHSFFSAKSRHDVGATMSHFSTKSVTYVDATLGWIFPSHEALKGVFEQYMPKWPASGLSYPTRILGDERSAVVASTDTPELFGSEIRILAAVDLKDGKVVRWVDYHDGRSFGAGGSSPSNATLLVPCRSCLRVPARPCSTRSATISAAATNGRPPLPIARPCAEA